MGIALESIGEGPGGAPSRYAVSYDSDRFGEHLVFMTPTQPGLTNEVLLAVVIDRLEAFQRGSFACPENKAAINYFARGLDCLHQRTRARVKQGVEGRMEKHATEPPKRVRLEGDILIVGKRSMSREALTGWAAWTNVEAEIRQFDSPLTPEDWAILESMAVGAGRHGFAEMKQSLARSAKVPADLPKV